MDMAMAPQLLPHPRRRPLLLAKHPVAAHRKISKNLRNQSENLISPRPEGPSGLDFEAVARDGDGGGGAETAPVCRKWAADAVVVPGDGGGGVECAI